MTPSRPDRDGTGPEAGDGDVAAWFLGPKGENEDVLERLVRAALWSHTAFRRRSFPQDPVVIDEATRRSAPFRRARRRLDAEAEALFAELQHSAPFASMRYQGHMLWDQVLPGTVGYFAAMLYNQNNVAAEASPVTTALELRVGRELCAMLGYDPTADPAPWGHVTCDGTVANVEAIWALRNARYRPAALARALRDGRLPAGRGHVVRRADGEEAALVDLDAWALLNVPLDEVLRLPADFERCHGVEPAAFHAAVGAYGVAERGLLAVHRDVLAGEVAAPVVLVPATAHYSWPKAGTLLGLGAENVRLVEVDADARLSIPALRRELDRCVETRTPVLAVVAVIGSTELGAVDPLDAVLELRADHRRRHGLDFAVHADAAWGGYFRAMYREDARPPPAAGGPLRRVGPIPEELLAAHAERQYAVLGRADSITVDPHKAGYVPYPAGALCYRDARTRELVSLSAPVVHHGEAEPSVGVYGIEGSKPGAAPAAVYLAHRVIGATRSGYGRILAQCVWTSKRIYCRLATLHVRVPRAAPIKVLPVQRLPAERTPDGGDPSAQLARCRAFAELSNRALLDQLERSPEDRELFDELGSDQVILGFVVNFRAADGAWNRDPGRVAALVRAIFQRCSVTRPDAADVDVIFTASAFDRATYGDGFVDALCARFELDPLPAGARLPFLITTTMNPWAADDADGVGDSHFDVVETALIDAALAALEDLGWRS